VRKSRGYRHGTRRLSTKAPRDKGRPKLGKLLINYEVGSQVIVKVDSSVQKSLPHKRFHGKIGTVKAKQGRGYVVSVPQGNAVKDVILRSEHLEPYKGGS
jgi:large subunit ribosomal protein L21e